MAESVGRISILENGLCLNEQNLLEVFNYLEDLAPKWKMIGLKLGIPLAKLDVIESTESELDQRLMRMTSAWLRRIHDENKWGPPTWMKLASVVEKINRSVAQEITRNHSDQQLIKETTTHFSDKKSSDTSQSGIFSCCFQWNTATGSRVQVQDARQEKRNKVCLERNDDIRSSFSSSSSNQSAELHQVSDPVSLISDIHTSYHGELTGEEAAEKLKSKGGHCYLVRYSKRRKAYVLTVRFIRGPGSTIIQHFRILVSSNKIWLDYERNKVEFDNLESLLHHYQQNPLTHEIYTIGSECESVQYVYQHYTVFSTPV